MELCRAGETYGIDLYRSVMPKTRAIIESGATPVLLQIGIDGLTNGANFTDVDMYRKLVTLLPVHDFRVIMVDPQEKRNSLIRLRVPSAKLDQDKVQIVNALVMGKCETAYYSTWGFSDKIQDVFGSGPEYTGWRSGSPQMVLSAMRGYVKKVLQRSNPCFQQWVDMARLPDEVLMKFIEEERSRCLTPSTLLDEVKVNASTLAMVVIDAEGQDVGIVKAFLQQQGFKPGYLQYEGRYSNGSEEWVESLHKMGYQVGSSAAAHAGGDSDNVIAVQPLDTAISK